MLYALGNETRATGAYSDSIPQGRNAGEYYVWYKAGGSEGHADSAPEGPVRATIANRAVSAAGISAENKTYDGTTAVKIKGSISGKVEGDSLALAGKASFDTPDAGKGKIIPFRERCGKL